LSEVITSASSSDQAPDPSSAFPTRRELRDREEAPSRDRRRRAEPTPRHQRGRRTDTSFAATSIPRASAPRSSTPRVNTSRISADSHVSTRPTEFLSPSVNVKRVKSGHHKLWSVAITFVVVPGLCATAALPAYASSTTADGTSAFSVTEAISHKLGEQSLTVSSAAAMGSISRDGMTSTPGAHDDYPWKGAATESQGGGVSPLGYYYRECVDFVAWRLNRDAGSTGSPWRFIWTNLTPGGGDASEWKSNWDDHGWPTGSTPIAGAVAWFNGNHVAYVSRVNDDGTILIEEYNHGSTHLYGQRTISPSDVALFLYAPPA
jgi:surface antigen